MILPLNTPKKSFLLPLSETRLGMGETLRETEIHVRFALPSRVRGTVKKRGMRVDAENFRRRQNHEEVKGLC